MSAGGWIDDEKAAAVVLVPSLGIEASSEARAILADNHCRTADYNWIGTARNLHYLIANTTCHLKVNKYGLAAEYDNATYVGHSSFHDWTRMCVYQGTPGRLKTDQDGQAPRPRKQRRTVSCHISNASRVWHIDQIWLPRSDSSEVDLLTLW